MCGNNFICTWKFPVCQQTYCYYIVTLLKNVKHMYLIVKFLVRSFNTSCINFINRLLIFFPELSEVVKKFRLVFYLEDVDQTKYQTGTAVKLI